MKLNLRIVGVLILVLPANDLALAKASKTAPDKIFKKEFILRQNVDEKSLLGFLKKEHLSRQTSGQAGDSHFKLSFDSAKTCADIAKIYPHIQASGFFDSIDLRPPAGCGNFDKFKKVEAFDPNRLNWNLGEYDNRKEAYYKYFSGLTQKNIECQTAADCLSSAADSCGFRQVTSRLQLSKSELDKEKALREKWEEANQSPSGGACPDMPFQNSVTCQNGKCQIQ